MKRLRKQREGAGGLEIIEEAVHLLRQAPGRALGMYFVGAIPFVLGLLFFQADMSRSARAHQHAGSAAFGMALLFLWLKTWQAMFARELQAQIRGEAPPRWNAAALGNLALWQTIVQPAGLLLLPVAAVLVLPFGWVFAFFQTLTALGTAEGDGARGLLDRGKKLALLWPAQNHALLLILGLFAFVAYINLMVALLQLPALLKTFLGVETMFARSSGSWFNTTTFSTVLALAFLCVDPLIKAAYVLRCFYGESLQTGADLKADLARVRTSSAVAALVLAGGLWLGTAAPAAGAEANAKAERAPAVSPSKLERSIEEVLRQRQYEWRVPIEEIEMPAAEKGFIASFLDGVVDTISGWFKGAGALLKKVWDKIGEFIEWISEKFGKKDRRETNPGGSGIGWMTGLQAFAFVLLAVAVCAAVLFFWRLWKRRQGPAMVLAQAVAARPDLNDESVAADQLEEDGWIALARELAAKGDLRLALRALYLATLAHLARRELITIARFKSNREYERELRRRARAKIELQAAFATSVTVFDRAWYGMHEVNPETFRDFEGNLERMRAC